MPLIVDANRAGDFSYPPSGRAKEIADRLQSYEVRLAVGGKLVIELMKTRLRTLIGELARSGRLVRVDDDKIRAEEKSIHSICAPVSDDVHILALARLATCRLIYTSDDRLIEDFKNLSILNPKGKVIRPNTDPRNTVLLLGSHGR